MFGHLSTDQVPFNSYGAGVHVKGATDLISSRLQNTVELERVSDCCGQPVDRNLAFCLFLQEPRELVLPVFVKEGLSEPTAIASMPARFAPTTSATTSSRAGSATV